MRLDRKKKSKFAAIKAGYEGPESAKERQAFCDPEWVEFETELIVAECEYIKAIANKDAYEAKKEILRSLNKSFDIS